MNSFPPMLECWLLDFYRSCADKCSCNTPSYAEDTVHPRPPYFWLWPYLYPLFGSILRILWEGDCYRHPFYGLALIRHSISALRSVESLCINISHYTKKPLWRRVSATLSTHPFFHKSLVWRLPLWVNSRAKQLDRTVNQRDEPLSSSRTLNHSCLPLTRMDCRDKVPGVFSIPHSGNGLVVLTAGAQ